MVISEALQEFDLALTGVVAPATQRWYISSVSKLIAFLGDREIETITIRDLRRWRIYLLDRESRYGAHPLRPEEKGELSKHTVHNYLRGILRFFSWLVEEELLEKNPATRLELPQLPVDLPKDIAYDDMVRILEVAEAVGAREYALICFLADTGCRVAGAAGLKLPDLELERGRAVVREKGKGGNGKSRYVFLKKRTVEALETWLSIRPSDKGDGVFLGLRGPLTESGIYQMIRRVAETAGIEGRFNPHSFRHGWARGALRAGADINDVSHVLGHSSIFVTSKFYGCWRDEQLKQVHDQVSWLPDEG